VATLGITPSYREFTQQNGRILPQPEKRLVDRETLQLPDDRDLSPEEAVRVIEGSYAYFDNPRTVYKSWFNWMENYAVQPLGASYFNGSACHLDLVQWATMPVWTKLSTTAVRERLLDADADFLRFQLTRYRIPFLLLNGRAVLDQFTALDLADLKEVPDIPLRPGSTGCTFFAGYFADTRVLAWSNNIPSKTRQSNRESIRDWLRSQTGD
jgi:hypothetical protein